MEAEQQLEQLIQDLCHLERQVNNLENEWKQIANSEKGKPAQELLQNCKVLEESLMQIALRVDALEISREMAAKAFREKDQSKAKDVANLLTSRKKTHDQVHELLKRIDCLTRGIQVQLGC
eukprot:jgi/Galph1/1835/GphlegSOOS_G517.1